MTKYFYTDTLAAAWMNAHFKMEFEAGTWEAVHEVSDYGRESVCMYGFDDTKIHIHPDSLHLLDPKICDICNVNESGYGIIIGFDLVTQKAVFANGILGALENIKIIQRNGIPFMWPESEET